jgi:hypothetical protein
MHKETSEGIENLESTKRPKDLTVKSETEEEYSNLVDEPECRAAFGSVVFFYVRVPSPRRHLNSPNL